MMRTSLQLGTLGAIAVLAACAQKPPAPATPPPPQRNVMVCTHEWCPIYVVVSESAGSAVASLQWDEVRMMSKRPSATVQWQLIAGPDYEFRTYSVVATGSNAAGAASQFPVRLLSPTLYALDDLNSNDLTYTYEVRVYRKASPSDAPAAAVTTGTIINAAN